MPYFIRKLAKEKGIELKLCRRLWLKSLASSTLTNKISDDSSIKKSEKSRVHGNNIFSSAYVTFLALLEKELRA